MIAHRETKGAVEGYALTVAKDGPRMEAVKEEKASDDPTISDGWVTAHGQSQDVIIEGHRATMLQVTETLQRLLNTSALDQTGLAGKYNFRIEFKEAMILPITPLWWPPLGNSGLSWRNTKVPSNFW